MCIIAVVIFLFWHPAQCRLLLSINLLKRITRLHVRNSNTIWALCAHPRNVTTIFLLSAREKSIREDEMKERKNKKEKIIKREISHEASRRNLSQFWQTGYFSKYIHDRTYAPLIRIYLYVLEFISNGSVHLFYNYRMTLSKN